MDMNHEPMPQPAREPASGGSPGFFGGLLGDLKQQTADLIRAEIRLARAEVTNNVRDMGKDAGLLAAGGALAYAGSLSILASAVYLLSRWLPRWLAALLVGLLAIGAGGAMAQRGRQNMMQADLMPDRTIDSVKDVTGRI